MKPGVFGAKHKQIVFVFPKWSSGLSIKSSASQKATNQAALCRSTDQLPRGFSPLPHWETHHGCRHEEVPRQEGGQAHDEENNPYCIVSVAACGNRESLQNRFPVSSTRSSLKCDFWPNEKQRAAYLSRGALIAVMVPVTVGGTCLAT